MLSSPINDANINDYGRFDDLKNSVDKEKAKVYFEALEGSKIAPFKVNMKIHNLLKDFIVNGEYAL